MSKRNLFYFVLLRFTVGLKNSSHFFIQQDVKLKQIVTSSLAYIFPHFVPAAYSFFQFWLVYWIVCRGGSRKFRKSGPSPPSLPPLNETSLFRRCSIQHCERIRDAKLSNVNVSEDRIKKHLIKRFLGRLKGLRSYKNVLKKDGGGGGHDPLTPWPPPLNPPMICVPL